MSKYLTYEERLQIEAGLKENLSFGAIGRQIGKDRTTIAKEIKKHSREKNPVTVVGHIMHVTIVVTARQKIFVIKINVLPIVNYAVIVTISALILKKKFALYLLNHPMFVMDAGSITNVL